jgi:hypothetical protein
MLLAINGVQFFLESLNLSCFFFEIRGYDMRRYYYTIIGVVVAVMVTAVVTTFSFEKVQGATDTHMGSTSPTGNAPIATAGDHYSRFLASKD